jgi:hypothetical protein
LLFLGGDGQGTTGGYLRQVGVAEKRITYYTVVYVNSILQDVLRLLYLLCRWRRYWGKTGSKNKFAAD